MLRHGLPSRGCCGVAQLPSLAVARQLRWTSSTTASASAPSAAAKPPPMTPRLSSTVLVLAPHKAPYPAHDYKIFFVQRSKTSSFMPGAYVFPGGAADAADADPAWAAGVRDARWSGPILTSAVTAAREVYEESGLLLATGARTPDPAQWRERVHGDAREFRRMFDAHGLALSLDKMYPWWRWVTPLQEKKRFDTVFFVAELEGDASAGTHDNSETINSLWMTPEHAIHEYNAGRIALPPPTWLTVQELATFKHLSHIREYIKKKPRVLTPIQPELRRNADGIHVILPGDTRHPSTKPPASGHHYLVSPLHGGGGGYTLRRSEELRQHMIEDSALHACHQVDLRHLTAATPPVA